jgi:hypothetical protein
VLKVCVETYVVHVKVLGVTGSSVLLVSRDVELVSSLNRDLSSAPPSYQCAEAYIDLILH